MLVIVDCEVMVVVIWVGGKGLDDRVLVRFLFKYYILVLFYYNFI